MTTDRNPAALRHAMMARLHPGVRTALEAIVREGARAGGVYAAGGVVRDLLLGRPIADLDLVTTADALTVVRQALPEARPTLHEAFRTASITINDARIDVATARRETYARPGALPHVEPSDIEADLRRRDFTINAMALRLDGDAALVDPCVGRADLDARLIRVLHDAAFRDDATRILRACRYAARLAFTSEPHTSRLIERGVRELDTIGGERLRRELELIFGEETAGVALVLAQNYGALSAIDPALSWDDSRTLGFESDAVHSLPRVALGFALLATGATPDEAQRIASRLRLKRDEAAAVAGVAALRGVTSMLQRPDAKPSGVTVLLDRFPATSVAAFALTSDGSIAGQLALRYLAEWRHVKPFLRGDDLLAMDVPQGPQVQRGLQLIRAARLDGWAADADDERVLVARFAKGIRDSESMNSIVELETDDG
ncbi:MAG: hypothetical protein WEC75_07340 [Dehalococcoidia bacterium]